MDEPSHADMGNSGPAGQLGPMAAMMSTAISPESLNLALPVRPVEMDVKQDLVVAHDVKGHALSSFSPSYWKCRKLPHHVQQAHGYVDKLAVDGRISPDTSKHQNAFVSGEVRHGVANQASGVPVAGFSSAEFGDGDEIPPGSAPGFGFR
jgi:hypothetical protein